MRFKKNNKVKYYFDGNYGIGLNHLIEFSVRRSVFYTDCGVSYFLVGRTEYPAVLLEKRFLKADVIKQLDAAAKEWKYESIHNVRADSRPSS